MCLLKIGKDRIFEKACFVLSRHEFLRFRVIVPSCEQSSGHLLTRRNGIGWLASMPTIDWHKVVDLRIKVSSTTALRVKTKEGPPNMSSRIFSIKSLSLLVNG